MGRGIDIAFGAPEAAAFCAASGAGGGGGADCAQGWGVPELGDGAQACCGAGCEYAGAAE